MRGIYYFFVLFLVQSPVCAVLVSLPAIVLNATLPLPVKGKFDEPFGANEPNRPFPSCVGLRHYRGEDRVPEIGTVKKQDGEGSMLRVRRLWRLAPPIHVPTGRDGEPSCGVGSAHIVTSRSAART